MSSNGSQPRRRGRAVPRSRRLRLLLGLGAAVVVGVALVAPIVLRGGSQGTSCSPALRYLGRTYVARGVSSAEFVEATAIGIGVSSGCGIAATNVDVRSLAGIGRAVAVGVPADEKSIYVRRGVCPHVSERELLACLRRRR